MEDYYSDDYNYDPSDQIISEHVDHCSIDFRASMGLYNSIHPYLSLVVCSVGSVLSVLNIAVLSQKNMVSSTNTILVGLAMADLCVMLDYIPYSIWHVLIIQDHLNHQLGPLYNYSWTCYRLFHQTFYKVLHAVSIWLTVTMAVWRYVVVCWPQRARDWCNKRSARWAVVAAYVTVPILFVPEYMMYKISYLVIDNNVTLTYDVFPSSLAVDPESAQYTSLYNANFWIFGVVIKLIPCALLTILSLRLVFALWRAKKLRQYIMSNRGCSMVVKGRVQPKVDDKVERNMDRTTWMLLAVLFCFLITEFPQGILALLVGTLPYFSDDCYKFMERLLELLILINCAINFILYCSISREFRRTFRQMFIPRACRGQDTDSDAENIASNTTQASALEMSETIAPSDVVSPNQDKVDRNSDEGDAAEMDHDAEQPVEIIVQSNSVKYHPNSTE